MSEYGLPAKPENAIYFNGYYASGDLLTSSGANEEVAFTRSVIDLHVRAGSSDIKIKINSTSNDAIFIPKNQSLSIGGFVITKFYVVDSGVEYSYEAMIAN